MLPGEIETRFFFNGSSVDRRNEARNCLRAPRALIAAALLTPSWPSSKAHRCGQYHNLLWCLTTLKRSIGNIVRRNDALYRSAFSTAHQAVLPLPDSEQKSAPKPCSRSHLSFCIQSSDWFTRFGSPIHYAVNQTTSSLASTDQCELPYRPAPHCGYFLCNTSSVAEIVGRCNREAVRLFSERRHSRCI
jgi:hypothetical protein